MKKQYELTVLVHPDLEMNLQPALDKINALIESVDGKIIKEINEGKKRMMYKIEGQEFAVYYSYLLELDGSAPEKINRTLSIMDENLRHLLVLKDARKEKMEAKQKADEEADASSEDKEEK